MAFTTNLSTENKFQFIRISKKEAAIVRQILKNKPKMDKLMAVKLSKLIHKYAVVFKADANRSVAIAMQESGYTNVVSKRHGKPLDIGLFQINVKTVKEYKFDAKRLVYDPEYSVKAYFTVMKDKNRMCSKLKKDSWTCYHSKNANLRKIYKKLVNRYYANN